MYTFDDYNNMTPEEQAAAKKQINKQLAVRFTVFVAAKVGIAVGTHYLAKKYWSK